MNRNEYLKYVKAHSFDLLVIGGGITGVGIALDAVTRGLSVALIDMQDFAGGTSSRSTKLIHGGLRYLKQFEFGLVNEVGRERAIVHRIAPHLVHPDKMLLPLIKGGKYGYWLTNIGLSVYDLLAGVNGKDRRRMLSKDETASVEPLLRTDILEGGGLYAEYRTDDARLVIGIARTAASKGAVVLNYVKAEELLCETVEEHISGVRAKDLESGEEFIIRASCVVNAAGPWVDDVRSLDAPVRGRRLFLTKGVHLVVDHDRLPVKQTVYFDNDDGRMIFAIPRGTCTYIGTTDTPYEGDKVEPEITREDVDYILRATNNMFPSVNLKVADIRSSWAGLRPLINEEGKDASEISRRDETFVSERGLISIAGGKLTGYRKMAERTVDRVLRQLRRTAVPCTTDKEQLIGGEFANYSEVGQFIDELMAEYQGLFSTRSDAEYLVHTYGRKAKKVAIRAVGCENSECSLLMAEAAYTVEHEMVVSALDFFERRTGRIYFDVLSVQKHRMIVLDLLKEKLNWSDERLAQETLLVEDALDRGSWIGDRGSRFSR